MFLNVTATVANWNAEGTECSLVREGGSGQGGASQGMQGGEEQGGAAASGLEPCTQPLHGTDRMGACAPFLFALPLCPDRPSSR